MENSFDSLFGDTARLAGLVPKDTFMQASTLPLTAFPMLPGPRNPAEKAVARLSEEIAAFEAGLSTNEEVGAVIVGAPGNTVFHIVRFYSINMDILVFEGLNEHRKSQRLIQHVTQLSILLTALPKLDETPRRIGFCQPQDP